MLNNVSEKKENPEFSISPMFTFYFSSMYACISTPSSIRAGNSFMVYCHVMILLTYAATFCLSSELYGCAATCWRIHIEQHILQVHGSATDSTLSLRGVKVLLVCLRLEA